MEPENEVSIEMKEAEVEQIETGQDQPELHNGGETERLVSTVYYDRRETKEKFDKIVEKLKRQGTDETDSGSSAGISVETMKFVIKCLDTTKNPFHSFMNVVTVKLGNYKKLIKELEDSFPRGFISLDEFTKYTTGKEKEENKLRWWYCCDGDPGKGEDHKGKLIDYFFGIANAQPVTLKLSAILFPLFALLLLSIHMVEPHFELKSMLQFDMCKKNETWRYFSYSLVHADGGHLSVNLVLFLVLGTSLHLTNKTVVLLVIYVLGVVSGSLAYYVFDAGGKQLVGCSGGVYCLVGASLSTMLMNWQEDRVVLIKYWHSKPPLAFCGRILQILRLTAILLIAGMEFGSAAYRRYHNEDAGVSVVTHIFGFLSGLELGAMLLRDEVEQDWEKYVKLVLWTLFWLGFGAALGINIVGAANFQGFWHQNFWDPEWIPNKLNSGCTP